MAQWICKCSKSGSPGSGKSYCVINQFIKQQIEKGFAMYVYDFKFDDLSIIVYNHLRKHLHCYKTPPKFYVINFDNPRKSHRCNPINPAFMTDISDAYESAYTIMLNLNKTWITKHYLVSKNLQRRKVLHLPACDRTAE